MDFDFVTDVGYNIEQNGADYTETYFTTALKDWVKYSSDDTRYLDLYETLVRHPAWTELCDFDLDTFLEERIKHCPFVKIYLLVARCRNEHFEVKCFTLEEWMHEYGRIWVRT